MSENVTLTVSNGDYLVDGIQLRERKLVPRWLGNLILWLFFHRTDTRTSITISGLTTGGLSWARWEVTDCARLTSDSEQV